MRWSSRLRRHGGKQVLEGKRSACRLLAGRVVGEIEQRRYAAFNRGGQLSFKDQRRLLVAQEMIRKIDSHPLRLPYMLDQIELFGAVVHVKVERVST